MRAMAYAELRFFQVFGNRLFLDACYDVRGILWQHWNNQASYTLLSLVTE